MTSHPLNRQNMAQSLAKWMIPPSSAWRRKSASAFVSSQLYWPLIYLMLSLFLLLVSAFALPYFKTDHIILGAVQAAMVAFSFACVFYIVAKIRSNLLDPLTHLRFWAMRIRGGHMLARIPEPEEGGEFAELARDINSLSDSLRDLTHDMKEQVRIQTERTAQKSHSLKILYDVATTINSSRNLDELLSHFLHTFSDLVHAKAASIRLLTDDNQLRLVASTGLKAEVIAKERIIPIHNCLCGKVARDGKLKCQTVKDCNDIMAIPLFDDQNMSMIAVPLRYRDNILGIYNLFVEKSEFIEREEITGLLTSIGQHLGVAIAKACLENDSKRLALMEERTLLSHELHDSLAQTLASLRFQVRMLKDTLQQSENIQAQNELSRLHSGLEKANGDLRELLSHFRTPMDERGLIPALNDMLQSLQQETGIAGFFQDETDGRPLLPIQEVQVLHIVQESLSNVRKHSRAKNVRLLIRANEEGEWNVLVEDDGVGTTTPNQTSKPGENIGLTIMRERTNHLKGKLSIESEISDGTRIELTFKSQSNAGDLSAIPRDFSIKSYKKVS